MGIRGYNSRPTKIRRSPRIEIIMEKYKIITDNIYDHYHKVITRAGLEFFGDKVKLLEKIDGQEKISKEQFLRSATEGMKILRSKERKLHDSLLGSIFCMGISQHLPSKKFLLAEPENESYDLIILILKKEERRRFKTPDTNWFTNGTVVKLEITELSDVSDKSLLKLHRNKLSKFHDYKGRILLISISTSGKIDLKRFSHILNKDNKNFKNVWLIARASLTENRYLLTELLRPPLKIEQFIIGLDFSKVANEIKLLAGLQRFSGQQN